MSWIRDIISPQTRSWERFYRNRWQYDKIVRSTHGVNCTGGCSWSVYVKNGLVTWELQALDYPRLDSEVPPYEPRGCQRGISFSWYQYSPLRVKHPYLRGALMDLWRVARQEYADPVEAWASIASNPESRTRYQRARGKGGFRRTTWDEALELVAAANIYTIKTYGADRIVGFTPIPAMSYVSYASGVRFLQLIGGTILSFYDWYSDLPPASPEVWGDRTDVAESADWYHSRFIVCMGSNLNMTRTPDAHFAVEARHSGAKLVVLSPDFSQVSKHADQWIPVHAGQDCAFWMAVNHVILSEFHVERPVPYFLDYLKQYTDAPMLVTLEKTPQGYRSGQLLRAGQLERYREQENAEWKFVVQDEASGELRMPGGAVGHRWGSEKGQWNLLPRDPTDGSPLTPRLTMLDVADEVVQCEFRYYAADEVRLRGVPVRWVETSSGKVAVTTTYDLLLAQFGVGRGLPGQYPDTYDCPTIPYTPAWQEAHTGVSQETVIKFAREWAGTAERSGGRCCVIIGSGVNHRYHNDLIYRSCITALMLCGCVGRNGGGLNHYTGQEKVAPVASWSAVAFAEDWVAASRRQNAPSWHYVHSDQWRYDGRFSDYYAVPDSPLTQGHCMDLQARAVRSGWLPFYPQFNRRNEDVVREAEEQGAASEEEVARYIARQLQEGRLQFSVDDPDAEENWPRVWLIWRANAVLASAKGHEYFLKHYLGTHHNDIAPEVAKQSVQDVTWHEQAPTGKMDLVVDLNFRMDTTALYSDVVLPAATWYEKDDLNTTDLHSYIHPLSAAVLPSWESRSDWDIFKSLAAVFSRLAAIHLPQPVKDVVAVPLEHDSPGGIAQRHMADWRAGECEPIPGKTMPHFRLVTRDYPNVHNQYISLGRVIREHGLKAHGARYGIADFYDQLVESATHRQAPSWDQQPYPSLEEAREACDVILWLAPETNGELAYRGYLDLEELTGVGLADLAEGSRESRANFANLIAQPRRILTSPVWTGLLNDGRTYSGFALNVERLVPWRTLTGRQQFYLDHEGFLAFGEQLPVYKPPPAPELFGDLAESLRRGEAKQFNYLTPHGKWHIHTTYMDNERMLTLSRGMEPLWLNDRDARDLGIADNDWVEVHNDNGVVVTRAVVSARIPPGVCIQYHAPERTISVPKSPSRNFRRAGGHNSLTRVRLKPVLMMGGYGQFTYHFNYWGPTSADRDTFVLVRKLETLRW